MNIIELANESGMTYYGMGKDRDKFIHYLKAFAALVEAAARADEREACAKLCDEVGKESLSHWPYRFANMIRARGTT